MDTVSYTHLLKDAQDSIEALEGEKSELEKINKKQSAQIEELSDSVEEYEGRISEYVDQSETIEEQLRAIEELNGKLSTLQQLSLIHILTKEAVSAYGEWTAMRPI